MKGHHVDSSFPLTLTALVILARAFSSSRLFLWFSYLFKVGLVQYFSCYVNSAWFQALYHQNAYNGYYFTGTSVNVTSFVILSFSNYNPPFAVKLDSYIYTIITFPYYLVSFSRFLQINQRKQASRTPSNGFQNFEEASIHVSELLKKTLFNN